MFYEEDEYHTCKVRMLTKSLRNFVCTCINVNINTSTIGNRNNVFLALCCGYLNNDND